jgi:uncharacterized membrane protein
MKKYLASIARRLNMPKDVKERVVNDFQSSNRGRLEAGQTEQEVFAELGAPKKAAAELNEQMKDYTYIKSPWRWVCLAIIIGCILSLTFGGTLGVLLHVFNAALTDSVGIIGGADGPTAIFITTSPDYQEYIWYQAGITVLILVMSVLGFWRLRRCPRK